MWIRSYRCVFLGVDSVEGVMSLVDVFCALNDSESLESNSKTMACVLSSALAESALYFKSRTNVDTHLILYDD
jgi:hypothetical protein